MTVELGSDAEARIQERIKSGRFATPNDVVLAGLHLLDKREQERADDLVALRRSIARGFEELDRGEGADGEAFFAELLAELDEERDGK